MFDLDKTREKIIALDESDAKSIVMMTAAYLEMAKDEKGDFTSKKCVDALIKILNNIPEPDVLKEMYKKKQQEK
ncbi:hypothetical protein [Ammoniphilus sp. 3BR4]|uniref:hypothetical protein n=1 Tax=Ammoniphilus sp. 3BR4 TaxID=3158265 RepID=UPI00346569DC